MYFQVKATSIIKLKSNKNIFYEIKKIIIKRIPNRYLYTFILGDKKYLDKDVIRSYQENGYSVDYAVMAGFIKASEVDNYDLSHADCNDNAKVYVGSISEENRYLYCEGIIYKGKKKYAPGEKVSVSNEKPVAYNFDFDNCKYSDGSSVMKGSSSEEDGISLAMRSTAPIGDVICPSPQKMGFDFYLYSREISNYAGYPIGKDDNISMNFTNASDNWQDDGEIFADDNSTFFMPNHKII